LHGKKIFTFLGFFDEKSLLFHFNTYNNLINARYTGIRRQVFF